MRRKQDKREGMKNSELSPLLDCDIFVYRVGFAANEEPLEYALATMRSVLDNIRDRFPDRKYEKLYLTGKDNFREKVAKRHKYKGNRDPSHKPVHYNDIRDYLVNVQGAEVIDGQEADDALGIEQWKNKDKSTVIVSIDKDLKMVPGFHYHPFKDELIYVNLTDANAFFFQQMLTGDRTDNIHGIKGIGDKTAIKMLAPCNKDVIEMQKVVREAYKKAFGEEAREVYRENAALLWMRREPEQECPF